MCGPTTALNFKVVKDAPRAFWRDIHAIADRLAPRLRREFLNAVRRLQRGPAIADLQSAVEALNIGAIEQMYTGTTLRAEMANVALILRQGFLEGGQATANRLGRQIGVNMAFDITNQAAVDLIDREIGNLITRVDDATRAGVRDIVRNAFVSGGHPRTQARAIRDMVGLLPTQVRAIERIKIRMRTAGVPASKIAKRLARLHAKKLKERAEMIARTETIRASNLGQQSLWMQWNDQGLIPDSARRAWVITPDDRLCPICTTLEGAIAGLRTEFDTSVEFSQTRTQRFTTLTPPIHPRCRCALALII